MEWAENRHLAQITKSLKTSSAVVPALLLTLICAPIGVAGASFGPPTLQQFFIALAALPMILTLGQILFFTVWDRDRLQNEQHVERKMLISRMGPELGDANSVVEISAESKAIENPSLKGGDDV